MAPSTQPLSSYAGGLDHLLAVVNVAVMAIDGQGRLDLLNDEAARLLRVQPPPPSEIAHALRAVSWLAHEVKNPLATIQLYTELIGRTLPPDDRQLVTTIKEQVNLAQTRISELLRSLSPRVEDSHAPLFTDLGLAAADFVARKAPALPHVRLSTEIAAGPHNVPLRPDDALSLLQHLVTNASQAVEGPGTTAVRVESGLGLTRLTVEDSGPGFPAEDPERLLQPFFTTKRRSPGLGLWAVKRICDGVGGTLSLENTPEGGARVVVVLPTLSRDDVSGKAIVVVDDSEALRTIMCAQLTSLGARAIDCIDVAQACRAASSEAVDAVVADIHMPGGGGHAVLEQCPEHVPVLLVSGELEPEMPRPDRPGVAFLMKPFSREEFALALSYLLWESALRTRR